MHGIPIFHARPISGSPPGCRAGQKARILKIDYHASTLELNPLRALSFEPETKKEFAGCMRNNCLFRDPIRKKKTRHQEIRSADLCFLHHGTCELVWEWKSRIIGCRCKNWSDAEIKRNMGLIIIPWRKLPGPFIMDVGQGFRCHESSWRVFISGSAI